MCKLQNCQSSFEVLKFAYMCTTKLPRRCFNNQAPYTSPHPIHKLLQIHNDPALIVIEKMTCKVTKHGSIQQGNLSLQQNDQHNETA
mmetsp:Transcript_15582/g.25810  ORF Transcript_15582/g.25810 Transcript_15582/m.25810 type:complete len:87 (-) Transcript_15582:943-1203(-)